MLLAEIRQSFSLCISRSRQLLVVASTLDLMGGQENDRDEILRATIALLISSLDYLVHEIVLSEAAFRFNSKTPMSKIQVPFDALLVDEHEVLQTVLSHVKQVNGYRSFVAPDKVATGLSVVFSDAWTKISKSSGSEKDTLKRDLKLLVDRRNKIVHEADFNPDDFGKLWSISKEDVTDSVEFISTLGESIIQSVEISRAIE